MDRNQGNQGNRRPGDTGGQRGPQSGTDSRNLGNMDDEATRRARREGGDTGSPEQDRDQSSQWPDTETGTRGGSTGGKGQGEQGQWNQGQGNSGQGQGQGNSGQGQGNQGGSNR